MAKKTKSARRDKKDDRREQLEQLFAPRPLDMPEQLIATRTFSQRGKLLAAGMGWILGGASLLVVATLLALARPEAVEANWPMLGMHLAWASSVGIWGLWCLHHGLRPALATTRLDAQGVKQTLWHLGPSMKWADVSIIELGEDNIRLRAGRAEMLIHTARNFVQRNEPILARWWRNQITGSGRRVAPLVRTGLAKPALWTAAGNALALGAWMTGVLTLGSSLGSAAIYAASITAAAGMLCLMRSALLASQNVTLTANAVQCKGGRGKSELAYEAIGLVSLNKLMLDFNVIWGEIELVSVAGRRMAFRVDGEAYENFSALIVRRCPRAFVIEHDTSQAAPPLVGGIENGRDRMVTLCNRQSMKHRVGAILAGGSAGMAAIGIAMSVKVGLAWLAALCVIATGIAAGAAWQDFARARHVKRTGFGLEQLDEATWQDDSVKPEDDQIVDMVA